MTLTPKFRTALAGATLALTAFLAGCASEPAPPPPAAAPPPISLAPQLIEQASAYRLYVQRASAISPVFADGAQVQQALKIGSAYEPQQLLKGAMAYGAIAALQDPAFVAGVRTYTTDAQRRTEVAYEIMKDPNYVLSMPGAQSAAGLVVAALGGEGRQLYAAGKAVKQAAYDVQRSAWSKGEVPNRPGRLSEAKNLSITPLRGEAEETLRLQQAAAGAVPIVLTAESTTPPFTPVVVRSLAVGALAVLGFGAEEYLSHTNAILADPRASTCLAMSKLNLYQCLAVSKPHYEDVFCLGQHALIDTGSCLVRGAGAAEAIDVTPQPLKVAVPQAGPVQPAQVAAAASVR